MSRNIRTEADLFFARESELTAPQRQCRDLLAGIMRLAAQGKGNVEGRNPEFKKKNEAGELVVAEVSNWDEQILALTLRLVSMVDGDRELSFTVNRWAKSDPKEDVQVVWTYAVIDERTQMYCPFAVQVAGVTLQTEKVTYGKFMRSTPKSASNNVLTFIAGRNHPARKAKFDIAAAAFKVKGWVDDQAIEAAWVKGEEELKAHLKSGRGRTERKGIRT